MANTKLPARLLDTSAVPALNVTGDLTVDTTTLKVDSTNNRVGIGIASPGSMLHLYDGGTDTKITMQSRVAADATASLLLMSRLADNSNKNVTLQAYRGNLSIIGDSGYGHVGIGTAPTEFFDVLGYSNSYDIGTDNSAEVVANFVPNSSSNRNGRLRIAGTTTPSNNSIALISDGSANVGMAFVTTSSGTRDETMVITSGGYVGIGTDGPGRKLHIKDNGQIKLENTGTSAWAGLDIHTSVGTNNYDMYMGMLDSNGRFFIDVDSNGEDLTILQNGNVGIGTNNPSGKLEVVNTATSLDVNIIGNPPELNLEDSDSTSGQKRARLTLNNQKFSLQGLSDDDNSLTHQFMSMSLANGYTGIGTTDPQRILQVGAHGSGNGEIAIGSSTSGFGSILFGDAASGTALYDGYLQYNHSTRRMLIAAGAQIGAVVHDGKMAAVGGTQYTPDVTMEVNGPLKIRNNTAGGISQTHTNMSVGNSGKLIMNFASIGTMTSGDTIVFTYNAISWKSWFFKIRYSSTGGYMGELWAGGYNNNSNGYGIFNPKNSGSNTAGGVQSTTDGATLTVSRSGQGNTMTLTLNNTHVHPLFEIEYSCGGGEGFPVASRASITVNS